MKHDLRPHQKRGMELLRASLGSGHTRPMLQAPTGAGKTMLAAAIVDGARKKGNRLIFVVPALSLINQTVERFFAEGIYDVGVIQADHPMTDYSKPVQVASVQTLQNRTPPSADIVVIDEAHKWFKFYGKWMTDWDAIPFVGLSATPWTKGLGKHYDDLLIACTTQELISNGYLSDFRVFAPSHPDLSKVRMVAGDYHEGDLSEAMSRNTLIADVVNTWRDKAENRPTICFAVDRAHAKHLHEKFDSSGIRAAYIDAYTPSEEREAIRDELHAGTVQVVCNVGCLTTGVDWDVRCIILARPTKSEMLFVQMIGRGLRTASGKNDCVARDTFVLTNKGEVKIQHVALDHKVWDGVQFVHHSGAICRGVQKVVSYDGLIATPDHKVMTNDGWKTIEEAARGRLRIARTGFDGQPVRYAEDCVAENGRQQRQTTGGSGVRSMQQGAYGAVPQHPEAPKNERLSSLQWEAARYRAQVAISALSGAARSLQQSALDLLRPLWRKGNTVSLCLAQRGGAVDCRESWHPRSISGNRQDKQQRPLRTGQSALGASRGEHGEHAERYRQPGAVHTIQGAAPRGEVCGSDFTPTAGQGDDGRGDHCALECPVEQAEREVWDILNAGPLQRFTANGRLVHNCLILDHSDNHVRLGFVTDIIHDELCDGKPKKSSTREKEKPLPKDCSQCGFVKPPKVHACPSCGFKPEKQTEVETVKGELLELKQRKKANKEMTSAEKEQFFGELKLYAKRQGYTEGWAAHKYREKTSVWPNHYKDAPLCEPSPATLNWIRSRQIAWAKRRKQA